MTSRRLFLLLALGVALPASAQYEVRLAAAPRPLAPAAFPVMAAPSAVSGLSVLAAPSVLASAPLPAAAAPAATAAPAVAAAPPAVLRAAALTGAVAEFSRVDLKTATAAEASSAGEAMMLRALGAEAPAFTAAPAALDAPVPSGLSAPRSDGRHVYLLAKPLRETVKLGPASLAAHAVFALAWELGKAALAWKATGSPAAGATVFLFEAPLSPLMTTGRSLGDLGLRYWRRKLAVLKELAGVPGVRRVRVLTTGEIAFFGPLAKSKDNTGFLFVDADGALPEEVGRFGAPIPLGDLSQGRVRLTLEMDGLSATRAWMPTLQELLDGRPLPPETAASWRDSLKIDAKAKPAWERIPGVAAPGAVRIEATLVGADGVERPLGALIEGPAVRTFIGLGRMDRLRAWLGWDRPHRSIPLSDSTIERPGDAPTPFWTRAWRRLTGRLIPARPAPSGN